MTDFSWCETEDSKEWDGFVTRQRGSIFHSWAWRDVLESTKSKPFYIKCLDGKGEVVAVCPFFYRSAGRRLRYLDSLPLSHMAGPIIEEQSGQSSEIIKSIRRVVKRSVFNPVTSMKIRTHQQPIVQLLDKLGFSHEMHDGLFILDLHSKSKDDVWNHGFDKHDRQAVKYYEERGSKFTIARERKEFDDYLALHGESLARGRERQLIPPEFFPRMQSNLGEQLKVATITVEDELIGGFSMICDSNISMVHLAVIGYSRTKNIHSPVVYMNWKTINWALENGFRYVNFGPTTSDSSNPVYKTKQKFEGVFMPRHRFTVPTSKVYYPLAKSVKKILSRMKDQPREYRVIQASAQRNS